MKPSRGFRLIRCVAGILTGLAAPLAPIKTGPAAVASQLRADPPTWLKRPPMPVHLPPLPPGWTKHPPLLGPAHAALAVGMPGWQITLLAAPTAVLAARMHAVRRRAAATTAHQPRPRCT